MELENLKQNKDINIIDIIKIIWKRKFSIIALSLMISVFNVFYVLSLSNIYTSEAVLASNEDTQSTLSAFSNMGGLASLAGIDIGVGSSDYNIAIRSLSSRQFLKDFIEKRDLFLDIFAVSSFDLETKVTLYDPTIYDASTSTWIRKVQKPYLPKPSAYEVREVLLERLTISMDNKSGFLFLTYTHPNPEFAANLLNMLIIDINNYMKERDIAFYKRISLSLSNTIIGQDDKNLTDSIYKLIEQNEKKLAVAKASNEYSLKIIDKPIIPERKSYPFRSKMVILMSLIGGLLSTLIFIMYDYLKRIGIRNITKNFK
jgi:uncharacterized protein involved in exopolysaccharide biosynthesis